MEGSKPPEPGLLRRTLADLYRQFISLKGSPHRIALGFAIGVFISFSPLLGFHTMLCFALCYVLRANIPVAYLVNMIGNPVTFPLMFFSEYKLGQLLLMRPAIDLQWNTMTWESLYSNVINLLFPMVVGWFPIGGGLALVSYFPVRWAVVRWRGRSDEQTSLGSGIQ